MEGQLNFFLTVLMVAEALHLVQHTIYYCIVAYNSINCLLYTAQNMDLDV
jgi:hypothetical protein